VHAQAGHIDGLSGRGHHEKNGHFASVLIGHADGRTDLHAGKIIGDVFDRRRIDIVAAADDQILGAAGEHQPFVLGQIADIPCDQPTRIGQHAGVMFRIDVAGEHLRSAHQDEAARERCAWLDAADLGVAILAAERRDQCLCVRRAKADTAGERHAAARIEGDRGRRLGHAVSFKKPHAGAGLEPLADRLRAYGATGQRHAYGGDIAFADGHFGERRDRRGHATDDRRLETLDNAPIILDDARQPQAGRRRDDHVAARGQDRQARGHRSADVEQRKAVDGHVELVEPVNLSEAPGGVDLIAVGEADELRTPGRAAGVKQRADGVAIRGELKVQRRPLRRHALLKTDNLVSRIAFAADHQNALQ
jgi:hypothetical protein